MALAGRANAPQTRPVRQGEAIDLNLECMTVEQGLQLIESERVQPLLSYLKTGEFVNKTNMTFMKAYSVVVQFGDQHDHSKKLYRYYKDVITKYCKDNVEEMKCLAGQELLRKIGMVWEKATILVFWMQRVFQYLDRFFTKNNQDFPDLFLAALGVFEENVYREIKGRCINALIETINQERNGYDIDQDVVKQVVEMLCTVGAHSPKIVKQKPTAATEGDRLFWEVATKGFYKEHFEDSLFNTTAEYYKAKVTGWLAEYSCPNFLEEVSRRLDDEDRRLNMYLDRISEKELRRCVQEELILNTAKRLVEMDSGCRSMFLNKRTNELTLMFRLFRREPAMLPHMTDIFEPYIEERCTKIVEDPANIDDAVRYIDQVLELKVELDELVAQCFDNHALFQKARNTALENVLNQDTRCAKYLALYCDNQLKRGLKGRNDEEVNSLISQVVVLFAHLRDKDIFLDFYKRALSKRLLNKLSVSTEAEDLVINKLKVECGQQAIQKLSAMFTDMTLSDHMQDEYNRLSHGGNPGGVHHEVRVLQTHAWPEKPDEISIRPCDELVTCVGAFEAFYNSKHSGRKLRWMYNMGGVEMSSHCYQRKHLLSVSVYQALCLMLFNKKHKVLFKEMLDATAVPAEELKRQVLSLTVSKHRLLLKDGGAKEVEDNTSFEVNTQFQHEKMRMVVGLIKKEEKQAEVAATAEAPVERKHVVDAAIVRIMKSRRQLDHNSLLDEVFRQCTLFKPQPNQIKQQIEHLIEREFLKRDDTRRNVYVYLP